MVKKIIQAFMLSYIGLYVAPIFGKNIQGITTPFIIQSSWKAMARCAHYRIEGSCVWLECSIGGCSTHHTPKVRHYVPELIVLVYPEFFKSPWLEHQFLKTPSDKIARSVFKQQTGFALAEGDIEGPHASLHEVTLLEAGVLGHPILPFLPPHFLKGKATPGFPYFDSMVDAALWRGGELEMLNPHAWVESPKNSIGPAWGSWGSVYPRTGFILQDDPLKSSAVVAVRALNIITDSLLTHIASNITVLPCPYEACESPTAIDGLNHQVQYQLIFPVSNSLCTDSIESSIPLLSQLNAEHGFVWSVWREYKGCLPGSGKFLYSWG